MKQYLKKTIEIAQQAGEEIAKIYHQQSKLVTRKKQDASFVTEADIKAHHLIIEGLKKLTPEIPIISEEVAIPSFEERRQWKCYWSVDPLDGTHEFISRQGEFVVCIALIENHYPVLGVVHVPLKKETYFAIKKEGAFKLSSSGEQTKIQSHLFNAQEKARILVSRRRKEQPDLEEFLSHFNTYELIECSSALKFCLIAEGKADIYPRFGTTYEWDIAAGQCILEEAGGTVLDLSNHRLKYNTKESLKNAHFLAMGSKK